MNTASLLGALGAIAGAVTTFAVGLLSLGQRRSAQSMDRIRSGLGAARSNYPRTFDFAPRPASFPAAPENLVEFCDWAADASIDELDAWCRSGSRPVDPGRLELW